MFSPAKFFTLLSAFLFPAIAGAACVPFSEASQHIGETKCVRGSVARVEQGKEGVRYLTFC
jgi:hypothetical protein